MFSGSQAEGYRKENPDLEYVDLAAAKMCPVSECSQDLRANKTKIKKLEHWTSTHCPSIAVFFCRECYYITMWLSRLERHYCADHGYKEEAVPEIMAGTRCCHVSNSKEYFIPPGKYHVGEVEKRAASDACVTLYDPRCIQCPVVDCGGITFEGQTYTVLRAFRNHWQEYHLPFAHYYSCHQCGHVTHQFNILKHYQSKHGYDSKATADFLRTATSWEQANEAYRDPGQYRLQWRKLVSEIVHISGEGE